MCCLFFKKVVEVGVKGCRSGFVRGGDEAGVTTLVKTRLHTDLSSCTRYTSLSLARGGDGAVPGDAVHHGSSGGCLCSHRQLSGKAVFFKTKYSGLALALARLLKRRPIAAWHLSLCRRVMVNHPISALRFSLLQPITSRYVLAPSGTPILNLENGKENENECSEVKRKKRPTRPSLVPALRTSAPRRTSSGSSSKVATPRPRCSSRRRRKISSAYSWPRRRASSSVIPSWCGGRGERGARRGRRGCTSRARARARVNPHEHEHKHEHENEHEQESTHLCS